jgi:hypothetical protein
MIQKNEEANLVTPCLLLFSTNSFKKFFILYVFNFDLQTVSENVYFKKLKIIKTLNKLLSMKLIKLAQRVLDKDEYSLALYLSELLEDTKCNFVYLLMEDILPKYYEKKEGTYTLAPDAIYRPLYYVHMDCGSTNFAEITRHFIALSAAHIEGCLYWLTKEAIEFGSPDLPFGGLVKRLFKENILPEKLVIDLFEYNHLANIPAKHFTASKRIQSNIYERTFSICDACLNFMITRSLSIQLFSILNSNRVKLPSKWKEFDNEWLSNKWRTEC